MEAYKAGKLSEIPSDILKLIQEKYGTEEISKEHEEAGKEVKKVSK